jgi:hypothetical protein
MKYNISEDLYKSLLALAGETPAKMSGDIFAALKNVGNEHIQLIEDVKSEEAKK